MIAGRNLDDTEESIGNDGSIRYQEGILDRHTDPMGGRHLGAITGRHFGNMSIGGETHPGDITGRHLGDVRHVEDSERTQLVGTVGTIYTHLPMGYFSTVEGYKGHIV